MRNTISVASVNGKKNVFCLKWLAKNIVHKEQKYFAFKFRASRNLAVGLAENLPWGSWNIAILPTWARRAEQTDGKKESKVKTVWKCRPQWTANTPALTRKPVSFQNQSTE